MAKVQLVIESLYIYFDCLIAFVTAGDMGGKKKTQQQGKHISMQIQFKAAPRKLFVKMIFKKSESDDDKVQ